ncbi:Ribonuclease 3 [Burkholderia glumae]|nr:Ribonuclease 3 [Burkholderia glumae]
MIKRLYVPILDHIDPRTLGKDAKTLLQEYLQGHKIALPTYTVVATHGAAHNQQFEVECTVPKLDVKVSGSGASRRAAEQAAAKKALDEVMARPMAAAKSKRSKSARASKSEPEIVPGVKGVQEALDLRAAPEHKERAMSPAQGAAKASAAGERGAPPVAVIRAAAHADTLPHKPERGAKPAAADKSASVDKPAAPAAPAEPEKPASSQPPGERPTAHAAPVAPVAEPPVAADKPAADKSAPAGQPGAADNPDAAPRGAGAPDRTLRARDIASAAPDPDDELSVTPLRVVDVGR